MRHIRLKFFFVGLLIVSLLALGLSYFVRLNYWECFAVVAIGILLNGWIATWEDNRPGGFDNPNRPNSN